MIKNDIAVKCSNDERQLIRINDSNVYDINPPSPWANNNRDRWSFVTHRATPTEIFPRRQQLWLRCEED